MQALVLVVPVSYAALYAAAAHAFWKAPYPWSGFAMPWRDHKTRALALVVVNVLIVGPAMGLVFLAFLAAPRGGALPAVIGALGSAVVYDVLFWAAHRACHTNLWAFKHVHAVHHRWMDTTNPICAFYTHPLEMALVNVAPFLFALWICGVDLYTSSVMMIIATLMTQRTHGDPDGTHSRHHSHMTCQYGALGLMDRWMGTTCSASRCGLKKPQEDKV